MLDKLTAPVMGQCWFTLLCWHSFLLPPPNSQLTKDIPHRHFKITSIVMSTWQIIISKNAFCISRLCPCVALTAFLKSSQIIQIYRCCKTILETFPLIWVLGWGLEPLKQSCSSDWGLSFYHQRFLLLPPQPPPFKVHVFILLNELSHCKNQIVGKNRRIVAQWWTLCESHLLRLYFSVFQPSVVSYKHIFMEVHLLS